jgi:hypothetical protein
VAHSNFNTLAGDSFHLMQQDWKLEIADRLTEIRVKENVSSHDFAFCSGSVTF